MAGDDVRLRRARPADAPRVAEILLAARKTAMPYLPELHSAEEARSWMTDVVFAQDEVFVAEVQGAIAGFVALGDDLVVHLYVDPAVQGRGIGSALLALAKEKRPHGFRLWVFQRNVGARAFYEARGCRLIELTNGAANEEREPDALYEWRPERARPRSPVPP